MDDRELINRDCLRPSEPLPINTSAGDNFGTATASGHHVPDFSHFDDDLTNLLKNYFGSSCIPVGYQFKLIEQLSNNHIFTCDSLFDDVHILQPFEEEATRTYPARFLAYVDACLRESHPSTSARHAQCRIFGNVPCDQLDAEVQTSGNKYIDTARAEEEADRITTTAARNLKEVLNSLRDCVQVVHSTRRTLEVDPECVCASEMKWERRKELHDAADNMEFMLRTSLIEIETHMTEAFNLVEVQTYREGAVKLGRGHPEKLVLEDDEALWCNLVCVHEKVDMDNSLWCNMPQTLLELVFARLPLHHIFQLRVLSKHWRSSITSATFQNAFGSTASCRFAIMAGTERKRLWTFGTVEKRWYTLPFTFLPTHYDTPIAGDGGLLCCKRPVSYRGDQVNGVQDLQLYVCNPLTQTWRKLPLPSQVQDFDLVHLVTNRQTKQYTITAVDDSHTSKSEARVEVYDSITNTWKSGAGIFLKASTSGNNFVYYKHYVGGEFVGIRAYDKHTRHTFTPVDVTDDIYFSEARGFFPLAEYQGQIYELRTETSMSGVWVLQGPSHNWERVRSVPNPHCLKFYLFSLYVSANVIMLLGERRVFHDDVNAEAIEAHALEEPENVYRWMLDRSQDKWIDMTDHELDCISLSEIMCEMRLDGIP